MSLRDHFQAIYDQRGELTPSLVVETARDENHPLHAAVFDKPPAEAAEAYYKNRAHELIQSCRITYKSEDGEDRSIRAFQAIRKPSGHVYEPSVKVAEDTFTTRLLLADMEREWRALRTRWEHFDEFSAMVSRDLVEAAA